MTKAATHGVVRWFLVSQQRLLQLVAQAPHGSVLWKIWDARQEAKRRLVLTPDEFDELQEALPRTHHWYDSETMDRGVLNLVVAHVIVECGDDYGTCNDRPCEG